MKWRETLEASLEAEHRYSTYRKGYCSWCNGKTYWTKRHVPVPTASRKCQLQNRWVYIVRRLLGLPYYV